MAPGRHFAMSSAMQTHSARNAVAVRTAASGRFAERTSKLADHAFRFPP
jgi:hypothetical protein